MVTARIVDRRRCLLGESPRWDPERDEVVWVDILGGEVLARSLTGGAQGFAAPGGRLGGLVLRTGGGWVVGQDRALRAYDADGRPDGLLVDAVPGEADGLRINELAVDPDGCLVFGTMAADKAPGAGSLWRRAGDGRLERLVGGTTVSNGLGWSRDGTLMYWVDSPTQRVLRFPYGAELGQPEVLAEIEEDAGVPDGLCVDADDGVWVAVHGGGQVRHYDAGGTETERVEVPEASMVASCVLVAGREGPQLYVTTSCVGLSEEELVQQPAAGLTFAADVTTQPAPPPRFAG